MLVHCNREQFTRALKRDCLGSQELSVFQRFTTCYNPERALPLGLCMSLK